MMRTTLLILVAVLLVFATTSLNAQSLSSNPFHFIDDSTIASENLDQPIQPNHYLTCSVDLEELKNTLTKAPERFSSFLSESEIILALPNPNGSFSNFKVERWSMMHPDLAKKYPEIQTYIGIGLDDPTAQARLDLTPKGFHGMIRSGKHSTVYIDPYSKNDIENYLVYFKKDLSENDDEPHQCLFNEVNKGVEKLELLDVSIAEQGDCQLRTYRLALACTGEYASYHGGTINDALAAMNTTMNRVNGIFENEAGIFMQMVANNDQVIYLDSGSDPYTNSNGSAMLSQNQSACDAQIGSSNYDIGHVFSTGGGGVAYLSSVCNNAIKAGGVTGQSNPVGDPFDVDYVSHEMGHQFGATHTQNNNCNRSGTSSMEPGSASTIMGYAGICSPNVQNNSDDYFHAISIQQMSSFILGSGNICASTTSTGNNQPTADAGSDYTIPKSTPFVLTGTSTDADGMGSLTYCWEQMDPEVGTMPPTSSNSVGPMFRSEAPTSSNTRYLPNLTDLLNNVSPTWEVLPSVDRTLNFRFTVRDNHQGGGCTEEDDVVISVEGDAGPFQITYPNTAVIWSALSNQTVTWDVNSTNVAPVNSPNVDILLSTDGGLTYPIILASGVSNDGSHSISVPNNQTSTARIMVRGTNHIFFDLSNQNFTIDPPANDFSLAVSPGSQTACVPESVEYSTVIGATGGFSGNVDLSVSGLPNGATSSFTSNSVTAPGNSTLIIGNTAAASPGTYTMTISASGSTGTKMEDVQLIISSGVPPQVILNSPANGATGVSIPPSLSWNEESEASSYNLQLATDQNFSTIIENPTGLTQPMYTPTTDLEANTNYFWRVRGINSCGDGSYSSIFSFTTINLSCDNYPSSDIPKTITSSGTPLVTSTIEIDQSGTIEDVNLNNVDITHSWVNDLIISISSPEGTTVTIVNQLCSSDDDLLLNFDDESSNTYNTIPCPPTNNGIYNPNQALSAFQGEDLQGTWTLSVQDLFNQDGGVLNNWELEICYQGGQSNPMSSSVSGSNITCNGGDDGSAIVQASGGSPPYSYLWNNGADTESINGLNVGTYTVTVSDMNGNTTSSSISLTQPSALVLNTFATDANCNLANGSITAITSGGTLPYSYNWSNGASQAAIVDLAEGTYLLTVTDALGCTITKTTTVSGSQDISVEVVGVDLICFGENTGSATANPEGGSNNSYLWDTGAQTQSINNLEPGSYEVTVTETNSGCTATNSITIHSPTQIQFQSSTSNAACGEQNGSASISVSGGSPPYSYVWSNDETTSSIQALAAGEYFVTIFDNNQCSVQTSVIVQNTNGISISAIGTDASCNGGEDGAAMVTVSGGSGSYSYLWSTNAETQAVDNLIASTYHVTVFDDESGCSAVSSINIDEPTSLNIQINGTDSSCDIANGTAISVVTGGTAPYDYLWSTGSEEQQIQNLEEGVYELTIIDANSCTKSASITIGGSAAISASISKQDINCFNGNDGSATANGADGNNYFYSWNTGANTQTISNLGVGNYEVTITESNTGCSATAMTQINAPTELEFTTSSSDASCGANNGSASISPSGGMPPYSILWSNGGTSLSINNISAGVYQATITDAKQCQKMAMVLVNNMDGMTTSISGNDISCAGGSDGIATISVSGGSGNISYLWNNGQSTTSIQNLSAGSYQVTATDNEQGCTSSSSITLVEPSSLNLSLTGTVVNNINNGSIDLTVSGGTPNYIYSWSTGDQTEDISNLIPGDYFVTVTDNNGCTASDQITLIENTDCIDNPVTMQLILDNYPGETTWKILNGAGEEILTGGPYFMAGATVELDLCLPSGCYDFVIEDSWGDGICCAYGEGSFLLIDDLTGTELVSGSDFGFSASYNFCIPIVSNPCSYETIDDEDFESGWGIWNDGGSDCRKNSNDHHYANSGNYCVRLRDNTNSSVMTTDILDLSNYEELTVDFYYYVRSFDNSNEDFWLQISNNGGSSYTTIQAWNLGDDFSNNDSNSATVILPGPFTSNTKLRFRADASGNSDWVYIDDVVISGCLSTGNKSNPIVSSDENSEPSVNNSEVENIYNFRNDLKTADFQLFPNPASTELTLTFEAAEYETVQFLITDYSGKIYRQFLISENAHSKTIDLSDLPSGNYFVHKISKTGRLSKKFILIR